MHGVSVVRKQVPLTPGFAVTDYKVQGATFKEAILDLRRGRSSEVKSHRRFCSTYVQLSRLQSLDGVRLLERIKLNDIDNKPHSELQEVSKMLDALPEKTLASWKIRFLGRRNINQLPDST